MKTVWLHFTLLGAALCGDSFAEHRGEVRLDNPFGCGFPAQPAQSLLTVKRDLLPKGVPFSIESLNKHVGLKDEVIGQMIRVQWSVLRPPEKQGGEAQATANYITDLTLDSLPSLLLLNR